MPFYWRVRDNLRNTSQVPVSLPFELSYDPKLRLVIQKRNKVVSRWLDTIYQKSPNIGNIQEHSIWSDSYKNDFLRFIQKHVPQRPAKVKVLEIGCGGCLILKELKDSGFEVMGIDPSPYAVSCGKKMGVKVIKDFFPSPRIKGAFDLIFHSDVIEHMANPLMFLKVIYKQLNHDGVLIMAIPDSSQSLNNGDISIFLHQHLNYFDSESLEYIIKTAGFGSVIIEQADFGGSLYCRAIKKKKSEIGRFQLYSPQRSKYYEFLRSIDILMGKLKYEIDDVLSDTNKTLGFYAPIRTSPYLGAWGLWKGFRIFDDSIYLHNKYIDGVNIPIENFEDLKRNPVTDMFIMSPSFGDVIKSRIEHEFGKKINVRKINDYYQL